MSVLLARLEKEVLMKQYFLSHFQIFLTRYSFPFTVFRHRGVFIKRILVKLQSLKKKK